MDNIVEYLIKSGIALSVFYLFYWLLMRKSTHFGLSRLTLATSLIASLILPLIKINLTPEVVAANIPVMSMDLSTVVQVVSKPEPFWGIREIVLLIYFSGLTITLFRLIYQSIYIHVIARMSRTITKGKHTIVLVDKDITPFAYFSKIFIPASKMEETSFESILAHEKLHLSQYHFVDLFLIEMVTIIQWFNPIVWLYERSLKEVHEYMADDEVLKQGVSKGNYQALLVNQALGGPVFTISHQFNQSLILKRIVMMTKMKSPQMAKIKVLLFLPLTVILLMAFSNPEPIMNPVVEKVGTLTQHITGINILPDNSTFLDKTDSEKGKILIKGKVIDASTSKPIEGVSIIIQGATTGTTTDKNGAFKIKSESSDIILIFTHIGFNTSINEFKSDNNNATIQMVKGIQELQEVVVSYPNENQSIKPTPYYVVDGVPSDEETLKGLDPERIASVNVLKGEQAISAYGEKGGNGVVLITTKKGNATEDNSGKNKNIIIKQGVKIELSDKEGVFTVVEQLPSFPGGENERVKFLSNNLKVPSEGLKEGLEGTVYVTFVVKEDGSIKDVKILRGLGKTYDEEVLRVVNLMPAWLPGVQRGKAVAVQFNMPVKFSKK